MAVSLKDLTEEEKYLAVILMDRAGVDQAEFLWFEQKSPDGCFRARPYQWAWWRNQDMKQVDLSARALDVSTPIPTPTGWTSMGDLVPGDLVYDETGAPVPVLEVSPIWTDRDCYEVCFDDHTSIIADRDHLWSTWDKNARVARNQNRSGKAEPTVRTTGQIARTLKCRSENNHSIDLTQPLQGSGELLIDPYFLGLWLGDGSSRTSEITTADPWVLRELRRRGFEIRERAKPLLYGVAYPWPHNRKTQSLQADLRRLGVLFNKHIPECYLRASEPDRRDILAGLVDSDGHLQRNGSCEVTQKVYVIAEGLLELLRSLGEKPRMTKRTAYCSGVDCGPVYRVTWRPRRNPALLPRKAEAFVCSDTRKVFALSQRRIVEVRSVVSRPVRCISVDSPSELFLAGVSMVPTHNTVGKSLSISLRGFAHVFCNPGQEMVVTAAEQVFLDPVTDLIEQRLVSTRLSREMFPSGRGAFKHRQFIAKAFNGALISGRIPQRDGRGVRGAHPLWLEVDESQDYPDKGYEELIETLDRGMEGAVWRAHGVTNGVGGWLYDITKGGTETAPLRETPKKFPGDWSIHRMVAMVRESWSDEEREAKIVEYGGSREAPSYLRNVLGQHGPASNIIFILRRLIKCCDDDLSSRFNVDEYFKAEIRDGDLMREGSNILDFLDFPQSFKRYENVWIGMDIGLIGDPSEILVFAEYHPSAAEVKTDQASHKAVPLDGRSRLKLIARVSMHRIGAPKQTDVVLHMIDFFRPKAFSLDKGGLGLPILQEIQDELLNADADDAKRYQQALDCMRGYNFSEKIVVDFDKSIEIPEGATIEEQVKEAGIKRAVLEVSTDHLRDLVDNERLWIPWDVQLIKQWSAQTFTYSQNKRDAYGRARIFSKGDDHTLDAARFAAIAHKQYAIEALLNQKEPQTQPVLDLIITHDMLAYY